MHVFFIFTGLFSYIYRNLFGALAFEMPCIYMKRDLYVYLRNEICMYEKDMHIHEKRPVYIWKETCKCKKTCVYMKRDLYVYLRNEICIYEKDMHIHEKRPVYVWKETCKCKKTCVCVCMKRDLHVYLWNEICIYVKSDLYMFLWKKT